MIKIAIFKRIPLLFMFLVLIFFIWVISPLWIKHLPGSVQNALSGSTKLATKIYAHLSKEPMQNSDFKPGHYNGIPHGASFIANFSVDMNVDKNMIAHPILKLNGNVINPPAHDTKDQFHIEYPSKTHSTRVSEKVWTEYIKAHPNMMFQVSKGPAKTEVWFMADKQWWTKGYAGKVTLSNATFTNGSSPDDIGAKLSGDQGFRVPGY